MTAVRILVVEDEGIVALDLHGRLRSMGFQVSGIAATGEDAIRSAREQQPDLILMDIRLKGEMDGIQAAAEIRKQWPIPIVFVTAHANDSAVKRAMQTGPFGYIVKPFDEKQLRATIEMALHRHCVEKRLQENERWLDATLCSIHDGVIATNAEGRIMFVNSVAEQLTGWSRTEAFGRGFEEVFCAEGRDAESLLAGDVFETVAGRELVSPCVDTVLIARDGSRRVVDERVTSIRDANGEVAGAVCVFRDARARRQAEEKIWEHREKLESLVQERTRELERANRQLVQSQKMEVLGRLTGGIAHDFSNMLVPILGCAELLLMRVAPDSPMRSDVLQIQKAAESASRLAKQLLAFSRKQAIVKAPLNLNHLLGELEGLLTQVLGRGITLSMELCPDLWSVQADRGQIEQVLMNLVVNAKDAMAGVGRLSIRTSTVHVDAQTAQRMPDCVAGEFVVLAVEDSGCGMDKATQEQVFEPFFTTKGSAGTGLGLSVVYGIVKQHGGWIHLYSEPGHGTVFRVYLPVCRSDEGVGALQGVMGSASGESILILEDQDDVRAFASQVLKEHGYAVVSAKNGDEARALFGRAQGRFKLVIADCSLLKNAGAGLLCEFLRQTPALRVLLTSGFYGKHDGWVDESMTDMWFLQKPFTVKELLAAVRWTLGVEKPTA